MGLEPKFTKAQIDAYLKSRLAAIRAKIIERLAHLGELCLVEARSNHTYVDQSGNLTSSMGYVITENGRIVTTAGFSKVKGNTDAEPGKMKGRALAEALASKHTKGYALYVVAGMNYAAYVEAKGKNVLTTAENVAEKQLPIMLEQLKRNIDENNT